MWRAPPFFSLCRCDPASEIISFTEFSCNSMQQLITKKMSSKREFFESKLMENDVCVCVCVPGVTTHYGCIFTAR
jgi:hypothetical protein